MEYSSPGRNCCTIMPDERSSAERLQSRGGIHHRITRAVASPRPDHDGIGPAGGAGRRAGEPSPQTGEPVRIMALVRRSAGQVDVPDVQINVTGLRPGERLHERLFSKKEERVPTVRPGIWATRPQPLPDDFASCPSRRYAVATRAGGDLVRTMPGDPLPDHTPVIDDPGLALASPYADEF